MILICLVVTISSLTLSDGVLLPKRNGNFHFGHKQSIPPWFNNCQQNGRPTICPYPPGDKLPSNPGYPPQVFVINTSPCFCECGSLQPRPSTPENPFQPRPPIPENPFQPQPPPTEDPFQLPTVRPEEPFQPPTVRPEYPGVVKIQDIFAED